MSDPVSKETLHIDPLVEVLVGLLIVHPDLRGGIRTVPQARAWAEGMSRRLRAVSRSAVSREQTT